MIIRNNKTTSALYKGTKEILKRYKGTLVVYEAWKKLIASGVPPITLQKCKGVDLVDYKIYGNSVQDGTPTPDTPIEIQSVGYKTKNLYYSGDTYVTTTMNKVVFEGEINEPVYFSFELDGPFTGTAAIFKLTRMDDSQVLTSYNNRIASLSSIKKIELINWPYYKGNIYNIQLEKGSVRTEYEPYGYKIPVKVSEKNILNPSNFIIVGNNGGFDTTIINQKITTYGENYVEATLGAWQGMASEMFDIEKLNSFAFKINKNSIADDYETYQTIIQYYDENKQRIFSKILVINIVADTEYIVTKSSFSNDSRIKYFRIGIISRGNKIENLKMYDMCINKDDTTDFQPYVEPITTNIYLNEPLRKIGDYADYIDFESGEVVRQIKEYKVTGKENWKNSSDYPNTFRMTDVLDTIYTSNIKILSNQYVGQISGMNATWGDGNTWIQSSKTYRRLYICDENYSDETTFKQALVDKYNTNNPVKIYYPLAEEEPEDIELPNIPTFKGTTIIEVDTNINSDYMEVVYYGKGKLEKLDETENIVLNYILGTDTETEKDITDTEINQILDEIIGG